MIPRPTIEAFEPLFQGEALTFTVLGRADLLKSKLFALVDEEWPAYERDTLAKLGRRFGHGV